MKKLQVEPMFARIVMLLIMMAVTLTGYFSSKLLLLVGMDEIVYRYPLAVVISYITFVVLIFIIGIILKNTTSTSNSGHNEALAVGAVASEMAIVESEKRQRKPNSTNSDWGYWGGDFDLGDGDGTAIFFFIVLVIAIIGVSVYAIYQAPLFLDQLLFDALLASGLIRSSKKISSYQVIYSVLRTTSIPFFIVFIITLIFAAIANASCPEANTLNEIFAKNC